MSTTHNDGGPAFPVPLPAAMPDGHYYYADGGMSLRDWLAGQAVAGMSSRYREHHGAGSDLSVCRVIAARAYELADAMIVERAKTKGGAS